MSKGKISHARVAPANRRKKARVALCRRRGRPFARGNQAGRATWFKPGECGRKRGPASPPSGKITEALRRMVAFPLDQRIAIRTHAEKVAFILLMQAEQKKLGAIAEVVDRCEGRAHVSVSIDERENPIHMLIETMDVAHALVGPPEQPSLGDGEPKV